MGCLGQISDLLAEAGTTTSNLVCMEIWVKDLADAPAMEEAYHAWTAKKCVSPPALVVAQAVLACDTKLVEIRATAAIHPSLKYIQPAPPCSSKAVVVEE